ncbi:MFS transporter [Albimonas sp. CAU 1670]|uniref:MFS transporter n=1 Tax=Albimonas sp. CAU 1670 TaxID=3032599 RepID=UPI0023DB9551|nr:MFS transporter [Albimonas sp. CAU 1670]MDF2233829.1 MFS transporter [Albimonas sp. CAU 1670]
MTLASGRAGAEAAPTDEPGGAPEDGPPPRQLDLLRARRFWPLFWVQFLGAFNDQVFKNGFMALLTWRLAEQLGLDVDLHVLIAGALYILPFALFSAVAGQIADGVDKARMMRWVKGAEVALMLLAALAFQVQNIFLLYLLLFLMGAQSAFFAPIKYAVLPQYLARRELMAGAGLVQSATFLAIILGQILGLKVALMTGGATLVGAAVVAVALLGWAASFMAPSAPRQGRPPEIDVTVVRAIRDVVRGCARNRRPFFAILCISWFWFAGATFLTLILPIAKETLHASEDAALVLLAAFVTGLALGAALTNRATRGRIGLALPPLGALGIAAGAVLFWLAATAYGAGLDRAGPLLDAGGFLGRADAWAVLGAAVVLATFCGLYVVPLNAVYLDAAPPEERGRFVACSNITDSAAMVLSSLFAMVLLAVGLGREEVFAVVGLTGLIAAAVILRRSRRDRAGR